jgi:hypothetical protein
VTSKKFRESVSLAIRLTVKKINVSAVVFIAENERGDPYKKNNIPSCPRIISVIQER